MTIPNKYATKGTSHNIPFATRLLKMMNDVLTPFVRVLNFPIAASYPDLIFQEAFFEKETADSLDDLKRPHSKRYGSI